MSPSILAEHESSIRSLGVVVGGSLADGIEARLGAERSIEDLRVGTFVVIEGEHGQFFAMLSDLRLGMTHPDVALNPPEGPLARAVTAGTITFGVMKLRPMLMLPNDAATPESLVPVKSIPAHFSAVRDADRNDVSRVFGDGDRDSRYFHIGAPLDMDIPVCLNLDRWVERSNGIFGKSGTGKTFLTRLCLCGAIKADKAVHLVFDMHSEYGWQGTTEEPGRDSVRGLKQYFGDRVRIFSLDPESTRRRQIRPDYEVKIPFSQVAIEDVILIERELNLNPTAVETCYALVDEFGADHWLEQFTKMAPADMREFTERNNVHYAALSALHRKLRVLTAQCHGFLRPGVADDAVAHIVQTLESGRSVVLEFGRHDRPIQYMLVANILTRRLHDLYVQKTEQAVGTGAGKPRPLVIVIEEAHKFLSPHLAGQTIFGTIAREMRKYNVTLLIVDQRPSGIDDEVLSQVGTKICCLLDDEKDVDAVLLGVNGASGLRGVLASLDTRQQSLLFGHAVPMPIVVRTRAYDDAAFRTAMLGSEGASGTESDTERRRRRDERLHNDIELDFA